VQRSSTSISLVEQLPTRMRPLLECVAFPLREAGSGR